jgi:Transcriptional regulator
MNNKKAATKEKIMKAAIKLIALNGFNATTTAAIAKEAGISDTIIFKYFSDKQTLLREVVQQALGQLLDDIEVIPFSQTVELSKDYPARDFLKTILVDRFEFVEKNFELIKIILMEMQYSEEMMALAEQELFVRLYELIGNIDLLLASKMGIPADKALTVLRICFGAVLTLAFQKHFFGITIDHALVETEIDNVLDVILSSSQAS